MARSVVRLLGLLLLAAFLAAPLVALQAAGGGPGTIRVVYFRDFVVYGGGDLGVCGVNYIIGGGLELGALAPPAGLRLLPAGPPETLEQAVDAVNATVWSVLKEAGVRGWVAVVPEPREGGWALYAIVSVPESADVDALRAALERAAGEAGAALGADVVVVIQVLPDDLFAVNDPHGLRAASDALGRVLKAAWAALRGEEPPSAEAAALAQALEKLGARQVILERPGPGKPLYVSVQLSVESPSVDLGALRDLVRTVRGVIGCGYPLVVSIHHSPIIRWDASPAPPAADAGAGEAVQNPMVGDAARGAPGASGGAAAAGVAAMALAAAVAWRASRRR